MIINKIICAVLGHQWSKFSWGVYRPERLRCCKRCDLIHKIGDEDSENYYRMGSHGCMYKVPNPFRT